MVLNNVTQFHKILIKSIQLRERTSLDRRRYVSTYGQTGVTLNAQPLSWWGHKNHFPLCTFIWRPKLTRASDQSEREREWGP